MSKRPNHLRADERRAVTIQTVIELAAEQNPGDITTAAIAQRMGLTQGAIFRHFPTKESIFEATMLWVSEHLLASVKKAANNAASPLAALQAIFMAHIDFVSRHPGVPRMLFGELQQPRKTLAKQVVQDLIREYGALLGDLLKEGKIQGELDPKLDVDAAAVLFIGTIQGLVMQSLLADNVTRIHHDAPATFAIYRRGIRNIS